MHTLLNSLRGYNYIFQEWAKLSSLYLLLASKWYVLKSNLLKEPRKQIWNISSFVFNFPSTVLPCLQFSILFFSSLNIKTSVVSKYVKLWEYGIKKYIIKIVTFYYLDLFKNEGWEWTPGILIWRSVVLKQTWMFSCPSIHGELVTDLW